MTTTIVELLTDKEIVGTITRIVRAARLPPQDLEDHVADVQLRVLKTLRRRPPPLWPANLEKLKALTIRCSKSHLIDRYRALQKDRKKGNVGLVVENADEHPAERRRRSERDALDHEKAILVIVKLLEESDNPDLDRRILVHLVDDVDQVEIAEAEGLPHRVVRDRVAKIRKLYRAAAYAMLGAGALVALLFVGRPRNPQFYPVGQRTTLADATPKQLADDLRELARPYCRKKMWHECLVRLDAAAKLDPVGDQAPAIQKVRDRATEMDDDPTRSLDPKEPRGDDDDQGPPLLAKPPMPPKTWVFPKAPAPQ